MNQQTQDNAQQIWDYLFINDQLKSSDCIIVLGSNDIRSAQRGVELFKQDLGSKIIFSGGFGRMTKRDWRSSEAEVFAQKAVEMGVPEQKIFIESKSTNTSESIKFTQDLINLHNLICQSIIIVTKPYFTRRAKAVIEKQTEWENVSMSAPQLFFNQYPTEEITNDEIINTMVGEIDRLIKYPEKGYIDIQEIPGNILSAYQELKDNGFTKSLVI